MPYDRPPLSKEFLVGERSCAEIGLAGQQDWAGLAVTYHACSKAVRLDTVRRVVECETGLVLAYDALVLACGSRPVSAPWDNVAGVTWFRRIEDAVFVRDQIAAGCDVACIGGGFIGSEVVSIARKRGVDATLIEAQPRLLNKALGPRLSNFIRDLHLAAGVTVLCNTPVASVAEEASGGLVVSGVNGEQIHAGVVVSGIGVRPSTEWLNSSGLPVENGVLCEADGSVVGFPEIHAIGDVAALFDPVSHQYVRYEHWTRAVEVASVVAHNIVRPAQKTAYSAVPFFWTWQHGHFIQMVGKWEDRYEEVFVNCRTQNDEKLIVLYVEADAVVSAVAVAWPALVPWLRNACAKRASFPGCVDHLHQICRQVVVS